MIRKSMTEWQGDGPTGSGGSQVVTNPEGLPLEKFRALAEAAKTNCPVSKALSATPISLTARLA